MYFWFVFLFVQLTHELIPDLVTPILKKHGLNESSFPMLKKDKCLMLKTFNMQLKLPNNI